MWENRKRVESALLEAVGLEQKGRQWETPVVAVLSYLKILIVSGLLKQRIMACPEKLPSK